jgi:hypothetical protein
MPSTVRVTPAPMSAPIAAPARTRARTERPVAAPLHLLVAAWVVLAEAYAWWWRARVPLVAAEDGVVEWLTAVLFAIAGVVFLREAIRGRRLFDLLVGAFCIFVAGEEVSWGQRLLGFTPPEYFLAHNGQQELNLHNMGHPRAIFSALVLAYGVLLPLVGVLARRWRPLAALLDRIGASVPPLALVPWAIAIALLAQWDPRKTTSEFAECLAGLFFLAAARPRGSRGLARTGVWALASAAVLTVVSEWRVGDSARVACARSEAGALLADVASGDAATPRLLEGRTIDKQVWQAVRAGELRIDGARRYQSATCGGSDEDTPRRRYAVDPWGVAYGIAVRDDSSGPRLVLYSFGPNRRSDGGVGDDIAVAAPLARVRESAGDVSLP